LKKKIIKNDKETKGKIKLLSRLTSEDYRRIRNGENLENLNKSVKNNANREILHS
jgi:hypothetical protein